MRKLILAALAAIGLSVALPSTASAQVYDPNTGQVYQYYTPYSNAYGTTYFFPGRNATTYYGSPYDSMTFVPRGRVPRSYGPGDIATYSPFYRGTDSAPYVTDHTSWYSPYRRTWSWGR
jgi:hypothetical protein